MVKRYDFLLQRPERHEQADGDWVYYRDYAALGQRVAELQEYALRLKADKAVLEAEVARLNALANIRLTVIEAREAEVARLKAIVGRLAYDPIDPIE
jgi:hypothetical protein